MNEKTELKKTVEILRKSQSSFYYFTKTIFKEGFPQFVDGKYIEESCNYLQKYSRTMRVAARSSFKSTSFYDFIQFLIMFEGIKRDLDIYYFSYNENQAGAHIGNIKSLIAKNPYFSELKNLKPLAENVAAYTWDNQHIIRIRPRGLVSFSRGMKADYIFCFPAKTRIETLGGSKMINEIRVGEMVKTHKGRFRKVLRVYKRRNFSKVYRIRTKYQELYATKNHPILATTKKKTTGRHTTKKWREVQRLKIGHLLHYPRKPVEKMVDFSVSQKRKTRELFGRRFLSVDFTWLLGLYAAEGSSSGSKRIAFTLGSHETELIEKTTRFLKKFFGKVYLDKSHSWSTTVLVNSRSLAESFRIWFGTNAHEKRIPHFIFKLDERRKASFLKGLVEGDGSIGKYSVTLATVSKRLRDDFIKLCRELSIRVICSTQKPTSGYSIGNLVYQCGIHPLDWNKILTLAEDEFEIKSVERVWLKDYFREYKYVYNLEVEEDNSYIANGFIVHNCDDPYSDPSSQIHPTIILKINEIFRSVILEAVKPTGEIHVVGTTLSRADIYFDPDIQKEFHARFYPAITHDMEGNEVPTWPEFYTLEQLKEKRKVMGERAFAAEMLCEPYYSTDSFFKKEQLRKTVVNSQLRNIPLREGINTQNLVIAGLDIGKKRHPSSFCYDNKTEVLTENGFKLFKDLKRNERVATLNLEGELEYQKPIRYFKKDYKGKMYQVKNSKIDLMVTPNHKMYIKRGSLNYRSQKLPKFQLIEAERIYRKSVIYKQDFKWKGSDSAFFKIPKVKRKLKHKIRIYPSIRIPMNLWLEFFGYWISEGSIELNSRHNCVLVAQSEKSPYYSEMKVCIEKMCSYLKSSLRYFNFGFRISSVQLAEYLKRFGNSKTKWIPRELLILTPEKLRILWQAMMKGDGNKDGYKYNSISKRLKDDFQELTLKIGMNARIANKKRVYVRSHSLAHIRREEKHDRFINYKGKIYSIEVPKYHIILVRRNGKVSWSGNSVFEIRDNKAVMVHHKIFRGWPYFTGKPFNPFHPSQVEYCREAIKAFGIDALYFDNTRGEFEGAKDSGLLSPQFIPIVFTSKAKIQMATNFEKIVLNKQVELLDDEEMLNSICSVTNDLQKIESVQGHGDDFDSIALALLGFQNMTVMTKQDKEIRIGSPSIFDQKNIPKGF